MDQTNKSAPQHYRFKAMASLCEILLTTKDNQLRSQLYKIGKNEVLRLEQKYSRYLPESVLTAINSNAGEWTNVDDETWALMSFADEAFNLSHGLFDATSGLLRKAWFFDGSNRIPNQQQIDAILPFIGWQRVERRTDNNSKQIRLPVGMELDFGGFVKEYAADRALSLMTQRSKSTVPLLVNLGGDLATNGALFSSCEWHVGVESSRENAQHNDVGKAVRLTQGALATSGDARRFLLRDGIRYSHILNPKTGWPVLQAPSSVTVAANSCLEAGLLSTVALLKGHRATEFLSEQGRQFWVQN